jgi:hypothetical protein
MPEDVTCDLVGDDESPVSGRSVEPAGVQKDENDATSWNVTRSEGIIESTDRRCNQNRIHLGNVG